jgi:hypothetical protein
MKLQSDLRPVVEFLFASELERHLSRLLECKLVVCSTFSHLTRWRFIADAHRGIGFNVDYGSVAVYIV